LSCRCHRRLRSTSPERSCATGAPATSGDCGGLLAAPA
jgi:hypothetical protein